MPGFRCGGTKGYKSGNTRVEVHGALGYKSGNARVRVHGALGGTSQGMPGLGCVGH